MLWCSLIELDFLFSLIGVIVYGLYSLRKKGSACLNLDSVYFFCRLLPFLFVLGITEESCVTAWSPSIDILLALLTFIIMFSFRSLLSVLLLLFAFIGNYFILHCVSLLTFFIALEAQNFCFLVLCGTGGGYAATQPGTPYGNRTTGLITKNRDKSFSVEASLKYFVLSAFSSGVLLFWFSAIYLQTGRSVLSFNTLFTDYTESLYSFQILGAIMFKLGAAPLHLWVSQIYSGVKRNLLMYISTVPKVSLFGFLFSSFNSVLSSSSVLLFVFFSIVLGSFSAYSQPSLRNLFAYSTINEIGIMLLAVETAGFHTLFQHLGLYIISQVLLWNLSDKRFFSIVAVSLAGLPPLAGFFGKAFLFAWAGTQGLYVPLTAALFCTGVSLVYYLRIIRLFWNNSYSNNVFILQQDLPRNAIQLRVIYKNNRVMLISTIVILLFFSPLFVIKPFVL